jgi:PKD repeat protein
MSARFVFLALITPCLILPTPVFAAVILSEVQIEGEKAADEFVELYNTGDEIVSLSGWSLRRKSVNDATAKGSSLKTFSSNDALPAHGYFLWANSAGIFKDHADTTTGSSLSDNNSLALYGKDGTLVDSLTWGSGHALPYSSVLFDNPDKKESFVRDLATLAWSKTKVATPTNSKGDVYKEIVAPPIIPEPKPFAEILINEVLPNPKEKGDAGEFIELYNPSTESVDLSGWEIHDASAAGKYTFPDGVGIVPLGYLVITDKEFSLSLNNSNETISLSDREKRLVHQVQYEKTKEGVSLNLVGLILRGARKPTPGASNSENTDPVTKERVPKKGYRGFATEFRARGKDSDGDKLKYTWDFGDGHKSYKENTSHKYLKSGRYMVALSTDDGIDTKKEEFEIKIEKYQAPKVRIVSFIPNPRGNDSELEWIEIENREKHAVNLKDFSIATGTKKKSIANHPIREDFIIPPKSVKRLTREHSLFTLGNKRGHIELRTPDGKVLQDLKYRFDKSLADDAVLKKEKGKVLALVSIPAESNESETEKVTIDTVPKTLASPPIIEVPTSETAREGGGSESDETIHFRESTTQELGTWRKVISYGTQFSLPESFTFKSEATPIPSIPENENDFRNEDTPGKWREAMNVILNRVLEKLPGLFAT